MAPHPTMRPEAPRLPFLALLALACLTFLAASRVPSGDPAPLSLSSEVRETAVGAGIPSLSPSGVRAPGPTDWEVEELRGELEAILTSTGNRTGSWGVLALSLDRGDTLLSLNPHTPLIPASNQKLLTSAAALHALGPDFRYSTFLLTRGTRSGDVLEGDLVLYGTGDPTLSDRFYPGEMAVLDTLARRLLDAGVQEIRGDLLVDGSYFSGPDLHPEWDPEDLNDPFAAPVPAVSFNENIITVRVSAREEAGQPPSIVTTPEGSGIPVINTALTAARGTRSRIWLLRDSPWDPIGIDGEIPVGGREVWRQLPVPDPLVFTGREMERALAAAGIRLTGEVRVTRDPSTSILFQPQVGANPVETLAVLESPPLLEILRVVNKESHNLLAEAVGKTLGRLVVGQGSYEGTEEALRRFLLREVGVPPEELKVSDGSGLSPGNRLSPAVIVRLLQFMAQSPRWEDFWSTLPEAGRRRELRRMSGTPATRNLRAKTGTMDGVSALSGMVRTRSGERILFSILSNGVASEMRAKRAEDQVGIRLASLTRPTLPSDPHE